jgi:hypothetical protein
MMMLARVSAQHQIILVLFFIYFIPYFSAPLDGEIDSGALDSA